MQDDPLILLLLVAVSGYVAKLWLDDFRAAKKGRPAARPLPGAVAAPRRAVVIAVTGAIVLLAAETAGEIALGVSGGQSRMTVLFACYTLLAAVVEEIVFRGFVVVAHRGAAVLWAGVVAASVLFAALHPFLWAWEGGWPLVGSEPGRLVWTFGVKGWFSTACVFAGSLWFYAMRFAPLNPARSLVPCIAAHVAKNAGVIAIKGATGFVVGWW